MHSNREYNFLKRTGIFCSILLLSIISTGISKDEPATITREDAFDEALKALKMNHGDIALKNALEVDPFRKTIINDAINDPIGLSKLAEEHVQHCINAHGLDSLYYELIHNLDVTPQRPVFVKPSTDNPWSEVRELPPSLRSAMDLVYSVYTQANEEYIKAFSAIDTLQMDTLLNQSSLYFLEMGEKLNVEVDKGSLEENFERELEREQMDDRFFALASEIDYDAMSYGCALVVAVALKTYENSQKAATREGMHQFLFSPDTMLTGDVLYYTETEYGAFAVGGPGTTNYFGDFALIIDLGGNDFYYGNAGGTGLKKGAVGGAFSIAIDLKGDDIYNSRFDGYGNGEFQYGAGHFGCGVLIDADGFDIYNSSSTSMGSGVFGTGILWDIAGDDDYNGEIGCFGSALLGCGVLLDDAGNDVYSTHMCSQGFGYVGGIGLLMDKDGSDHYIAKGFSNEKYDYDGHYLTLSQGFGYGHRPVASGGIGMAIDMHGNDVYINDIFGQGGGSWFGLGILYDREGDDTYTSWQNAQGSGIHIAAGVLIDMSGNDSYSSRNESQGYGHNLAVGYLDDRSSSNDNYNIFDLSQGAGNAHGVGIFIDEGGNDGYITHSVYNSQGYGNWRREYGSVGIFLDLDGEDYYSNKGLQNSFWTNGRYGIGIDFPNKSNQ